MSTIALTRVVAARRPFAGIGALGAELRAGKAREATATRRWATRIAAAAAAGLLIALLASHGDDFAAALQKALEGDWRLVGAGAVLEAASIVGYVFLLNRVVSRASPRLRLRDSYDVTLAGTAATRLLPTAGFGGVALTVWALRVHGVARRELAERMIAFVLLLYAVYMTAVALAGAAVWGGLVTVPHGRVLGAVGIAVGIAIAATAIAVASAPAPLASRIERLGTRPDRIGSAAARLAGALPALRGGLRRAASELRHPRPALVGAVAYWGFDIAVLFAMLHAFGAHPAVPVLVLAYFLGTLFNLLPLPGSLSGGLAAVLIALGTATAPAIAAVLAYRAIAVWLPAAWGLTSVGSLRSSMVRWRAAAAR